MSEQLENIIEALEVGDLVEEVCHWGRPWGFIALPSLSLLCMLPCHQCHMTSLDHATVSGMQNKIKPALLNLLWSAIWLQNLESNAHGWPFLTTEGVKEHRVTAYSMSGKQSEQEESCQVATPPCMWGERGWINSTDFAAICSGGAFWDSCITTTGISYMDQVSKPCK